MRIVIVDELLLVLLLVILAALFKLRRWAIAFLSWSIASGHTSPSYSLRLRVRAPQQ